MATLTLSEVHATQSQAYPLLQGAAASQPPATGDTRPNEAAVIYGTYACGPMDMQFAVVQLSLTTQGVETADYTKNQPVLGIIVNKPTGLTAQVVSLGALKGFSNLTIGARYFLGPQGRLITPPLLDPDMLYVHPVGVAIATDTLFVQPNWPIVRRLP